MYAIKYVLALPEVKEKKIDELINIAKAEKSEFWHFHFNINFNYQEKAKIYQEIIICLFVLFERFEHAISVK